MNFEEFKKSFSDFPAGRIVFIGLGNIYRESDTAGLLFLQCLAKEEFFRNSHFINAGTNPENHLENIIDLNPELIVFIDTAKQGSGSSEIFWVNNELIDQSEFSTHAYSIRLIEYYILLNLKSSIRYLGITVNQVEADKVINNFFKDSRTIYV